MDRSHGSTVGVGSHDIEDILQVGTIGLIKAIDRFDPYRGDEFSTLALPYITGEIKRHFRDTTWAVRVPRRLQELRIDLAKAKEELTPTLDRAPTVTDLAGHLGLSDEEVIEGLVAANGHTSGSLDAPHAEHGDGPTEGHTLADVMGEETRPWNSSRTSRAWRRCWSSSPTASAGCCRCDSARS